MLLIALQSALFASPIPIELDLSTGHHVEAKSRPSGGYEIRTTGNDPYVHTKKLAGKYDAKKQYILAFDYFCAKGIDGMQLFYGPPLKAGQSAYGPEVLSSEGWTGYTLNILTTQEPNTWKSGYTQFRLDFGRQAGRVIQLRNIVLREPNADELKTMRNSKDKSNAVSVFDSQLQAMTEAEHASAIADVKATDTHIILTVDTPTKEGPYLLCEVPLYQTPAGRQDFVWSKTIPEREGKQSIQVKRKRGNHDRVFSSWIVMKKTDKGLVPASHQHFVDTIPPKWKLTRDRPTSKKGLPGINGSNKEQIADYMALGIRNCTKNILLPALVKDKPTKGGIPHEFNGITVYIDPKGLKGLDDSMQAMEQLNIVVSAIILIPKGNTMAHPDCSPQGIYAIANVVEEEGWNVYAAGLDFLAQRYMRPDRKYGRITHWILHNEVDAGWVWTNAGEKPLNTYLDLYYRSMRTAQSVIRRYGNAGQVLISLTHYWTTRHNSKCYQPKQMIDLLAKRCAQEGNFDWGLAYHPYPENLRDPRTWLDKKVSCRFDTPLITPKNIEVLDAYMHQKHMLLDGNVRTVVLSEQGSNSKNHSAQSYRDQAAGLVYTWLKIQNLESIESYVHHRWLDHPREGGLNLGFRRRPESSTEAAKTATATVCDEMAKFGITTSPDTTKKPAWGIYRVLGTPEQNKASDWAQTVIPSQYMGKIKQ